MPPSPTEKGALGGKEVLSDLHPLSGAGGVEGGEGAPRVKVARGAAHAARAQGRAGGMSESTDFGADFMDVDVPGPHSLPGGGTGPTMDEKAVRGLLAGWGNTPEAHAALDGLETSERGNLLGVLVQSAKQESGLNHGAVGPVSGKSGPSVGLFQWHPEDWKIHAKKYGMADADIYSAKDQVRMTARRAADAMKIGRILAKDLGREVGQDELNSFVLAEHNSGLSAAAAALRAGALLPGAGGGRSEPPPTPPEPPLRSPRRPPPRSAPAPTGPAADSPERTEPPADPIPPEPRAAGAPPIGSKGETLTASEDGKGWNVGETADAPVSLSFYGPDGKLHALRSLEQVPDGEGWEAKESVSGKKVGYLFRDANGEVRLGDSPPDPWTTDLPNRAPKGFSPLTNIGEVAARQVEKVEGISVLGMAAASAEGLRAASAGAGAMGAVLTYAEGGKGWNVAGASGAPVSLFFYGPDGRPHLLRSLEQVPAGEGWLASEYVSGEEVGYLFRDAGGQVRLGNDEGLWTSLRAGVRTGLAGVSGSAKTGVALVYNLLASAGEGSGDPEDEVEELRRIGAEWESAAMLDMTEAQRKNMDILSLPPKVLRRGADGEFSINVGPQNIVGLTGLAVPWFLPAWGGSGGFRGAAALARLAPDKRDAAAGFGAGATVGALAGGAAAQDALERIPADIPPEERSQRALAAGIIAGAGSHYLNRLFFSKGIRPAADGWLSTGLREGAVEFFQEPFQQAVSAAAAGDKLSAPQYAEAALAGMIAGGGAGGAATVAGKPTMTLMDYGVRNFMEILSGVDSRMSAPLRRRRLVGVAMGLERRDAQAAGLEGPELEAQVKERKEYEEGLLSMEELAPLNLREADDFASWLVNHADDPLPRGTAPKWWKWGGAEAPPEAKERHMAFLIENVAPDLAERRRLLDEMPGWAQLTRAAKIKRDIEKRGITTLGRNGALFPGALEDKAAAKPAKPAKSAEKTEGEGALNIPPKTPKGDKDGSGKGGKSAEIPADGGKDGGGKGAKTPPKSGKGGASGKPQAPGKTAPESGDGADGGKGDKKGGGRKPKPAPTPAAPAVKPPPPADAPKRSMEELIAKQDETSKRLDELSAKEKDGGKLTPFENAEANLLGASMTHLQEAMDDIAAHKVVLRGGTAGEAIDAVRPQFPKDHSDEDVAKILETRGYEITRGEDGDLRSAKIASTKKAEESVGAAVWVFESGDMLALEKLRAGDAETLKEFGLTADDVPDAAPKVGGKKSTPTAAAIKKVKAAKPKQPRRPAKKDTESAGAWARAEDLSAREKAFEQDSEPNEETDESARDKRINELPESEREFAREWNNDPAATGNPGWMAERTKQDLEKHFGVKMSDETYEFIRKEDADTAVIVQVIRARQANQNLGAMAEFAEAVGDGATVAAVAAELVMKASAVRDDAKDYGYEIEGKGKNERIKPTDESLDALDAAHIEVSKAAEELAAEEEHLKGRGIKGYDGEPKPAPEPDPEPDEEPEPSVGPADADIAQTAVDLIRAAEARAEKMPAKSKRGFMAGLARAKDVLFGLGPDESPADEATLKTTFQHPDKMGLEGEDATFHWQKMHDAVKSLWWLMNKVVNDGARADLEREITDAFKKTDLKLLGIEMVGKSVEREESGLYYITPPDPDEGGDGDVVMVKRLIYPGLGPHWAKAEWGAPDASAPEPAPAAASGDAADFKLPADVAKSKPRYGLAKLDFESPFDLAAYTIRNKKTKSKGEDRIVAALTEQGFDVEEVRQHGEVVKDAIKEIVKAETGSAAAPQEVLEFSVPAQDFSPSAPEPPTEPEGGKKPPPTVPPKQKPGEKSEGEPDSTTPEPGGEKAAAAARGFDWRAEPERGDPDRWIKEAAGTVRTELAGFMDEDILDIGVDAEALQYRLDADGEGGTKKLLDTSLSQAPASVSNRPSLLQMKTGEFLVVNGHHRLARAKAQVERNEPGAYMDVSVYREADGWTKERARMMGALENMASPSSDNDAPWAAALTYREAQGNPDAEALLDAVEKWFPHNVTATEWGQDIANIPGEKNFEYALRNRRKLNPEFIALIGPSGVGEEAAKDLLRRFISEKFTRDGAQTLVQMVADTEEKNKNKEAGQLLPGMESPNDDIPAIEKAMLVERIQRVLRQKKGRGGLMRKQGDKVEGEGLAEGVDADKATEQEKAAKAALADLIVRATRKGDFSTFLNRLAATIKKRDGQVKDDDVEAALTEMARLGLLGEAAAPTPEPEPAAPRSAGEMSSDALTERMIEVGRARQEAEGPEERTALEAVERALEKLRPLIMMEANVGEGARLAEVSANFGHSILPKEILKSARAAMYVVKKEGDAYNIFPTSSSRHMVSEAQEELDAAEKELTGKSDLARPASAPEPAAAPKTAPEAGTVEEVRAQFEGLLARGRNLLRLAGEENEMLEGMAQLMGGETAGGTALKLVKSGRQALEVIDSGDYDLEGLKAALKRAIYQTESAEASETHIREGMEEYDTNAWAAEVNPEIIAALLRAGEDKARIDEIRKASYAARGDDSQLPALREVLARDSEAADEEPPASEEDDAEGGDTTYAEGDVETETGRGFDEYTAEGLRKAVQRVLGSGWKPQSADPDGRGGVNKWVWLLNADGRGTAVSEFFGERKGEDGANLAYYEEADRAPRGSERELFRHIMQGYAVGFGGMQLMWKAGRKPPRKAKVAGLVVRYSPSGFDSGIGTIRLKFMDTGEEVEAPWAKFRKLITAGPDDPVRFLGWPDIETASPPASAAEAKPAPADTAPPPAETKPETAGARLAEDSPARKIYDQIAGWYISPNGGKFQSNKALREFAGIELGEENAVSKINNAAEVARNALIMDLGITDWEDAQRVQDMFPAQERDEKMKQLQAFSTPHAIAAMVAKAAGLRPGEVALEPCAGTGNLATMVGRKNVDVNEWDDDRRGDLRALGWVNLTAMNKDKKGGRILRTGAADANALDLGFSERGRYDVVIMNPPFSTMAADAARIGAKNAKMRPGKETTEAYIRTAGMTVKPGGRMVIITGDNWAPDNSSSVKRWVADRNAEVAADIRALGKLYAKQGATADIRVSVIDFGPNVGKKITGAAESMGGLAELMGEIRGRVPKTGTEERQAAEAIVQAEAEEQAAPPPAAGEAVRQFGDIPVEERSIENYPQRPPALTGAKLSDALGDWLDFELWGREDTGIEQNDWSALMRIFGGTPPEGLRRWWDKRAETMDDGFRILSLLPSRLVRGDEGWRGELKYDLGNFISRDNLLRLLEAEAAAKPAAGVLTEEAVEESQNDRVREALVQGTLDAGRKEPEGELRDDESAPEAEEAVDSPNPPDAGTSPDTPPQVSENESIREEDVAATAKLTDEQIEKKRQAAKARRTQVESSAIFVDAEFEDMGAGADPHPVPVMRSRAFSAVQPPPLSAKSKLAVQKVYASIKTVDEGGKAKFKLSNAQLEYVARVLDSWERTVLQPTLDRGKEFYAEMKALEKTRSEDGVAPLNLSAMTAAERGRALEVRRGSVVGAGTGFGKTQVGLALMKAVRMEGNDKPFLVLTAGTGKVRGDGANPLFETLQDEGAGFGLGDQMIGFDKSGYAGPNKIIFSSYDTIKFTPRKGDQVANLRTGELLSEGMKALENMLLPQAKSQAERDAAAREYDGVIVLDEFHKSKNVLGEMLEFGTTEGSKTAQAVAGLHIRFPKARILYMSATPFSKPSNLVSAVRALPVGDGELYGRYPTLLNDLREQGTALVEALSQEMRAEGFADSVELSMKGVEMDKLEVKYNKRQEDNEEKWAPILGDLRRSTMDALIRSAESQLDGGEKLTKGMTSDLRRQMLSALGNMILRIDELRVAAMTAPAVGRDAARAFLGAKVGKDGKVKTGKDGKPDIAPEDENRTNKITVQTSAIWNEYTLREIDRALRIQNEEGREAAEKSGKKFMAMSTEDDRFDWTRVDFSPAAAVNALLDDHYNVAATALMEGLDGAKRLEVLIRGGQQDPDEFEMAPDGAGGVKWVQVVRNPGGKGEKYVKKPPGRPLDIGPGGTEAMQLRTDKSGRTFYVAVTVDPELIKERDAFKARVSEMEQDISRNPLDEIRWSFAAEMFDLTTAKYGKGRGYWRELGLITGQKMVLDLGDSNKAPSTSGKMVPHKKTKGQVIEDYQGDHIAGVIFSEKGGTGINLQSDPRNINARRVRHYIFNAGSKADAFKQGMGRVHRARQKWPPIYVLVGTSSPVSNFMLSRITAKLREMGALTGGDRRTGGSDIAASGMVLEGGKSANMAVRSLFADILENNLKSKGLVFGNPAAFLVDGLRIKLTNSKANPAFPKASDLDANLDKFMRGLAGPSEPLPQGWTHLRFQQLIVSELLARGQAAKELLEAAGQSPDGAPKVMAPTGGSVLVDDTATRTLPGGGVVRRAIVRRPMVQLTAASALRHPKARRGWWMPNRKNPDLMRPVVFYPDRQKELVIQGKNEEIKETPGSRMLRPNSGGTAGHFINERAYERRLDDIYFLVGGSDERTRKWEEAWEREAENLGTIDDERWFLTGRGALRLNAVMPRLGAKTRRGYKHIVPTGTLLDDGGESDGWADENGASEFYGWEMPAQNNSEIDAIHTFVGKYTGEMPADVAPPRDLVGEMVKDGAVLTLRTKDGKQFSAKWAKVGKVFLIFGGPGAMNDIPYEWDLTKQNGWEQVDAAVSRGNSRKQWKTRDPEKMRALADAFMAEPDDDGDGGGGEALSMPELPTQAEFLPIHIYISKPDDAVQNNFVAVGDLPVVFPGNSPLGKRLVASAEYSRKSETASGGWRPTLNPAGELGIEVVSEALRREPERTREYLNNRYARGLVGWSNMVALARKTRQAQDKPAETAALKKNLDAVVKKLAGNANHIRYEIQKYHPLGASAQVQISPEGVALITLYEFALYGARSPAQMEGALAHEIVHSGIWMMMDPKRRARVRRLTPKYMAVKGVRARVIGSLRGAGMSAKAAERAVVAAENGDFSKKAADNAAEEAFAYAVEKYATSRAADRDKAVGAGLLRQTWEALKELARAVLNAFGGGPGARGLVRFYYEGGGAEADAAELKKRLRRHDFSFGDADPGKFQQTAIVLTTGKRTAALTVRALATKKNATLSAEELAAHLNGGEPLELPADVLAAAQRYFTAAKVLSEEGDVFNDGKSLFRVAEGKAAKPGTDIFRYDPPAEDFGLRQSQNKPAPPPATPPAQPGRGAPRSLGMRTPPPKGGLFSFAENHGLSRKAARTMMGEIGGRFSFPQDGVILTPEEMRDPKSVAPVDYSIGDNYGDWTRESVAKFLGVAADEHVYKALVNSGELSPKLVEEDEASEIRKGNRDDYVMDDKAGYKADAIDLLTRHKDEELTRDEEDEYDGFLPWDDWTEKDAERLAREIAARYNERSVEETGGLEEFSSSAFPAPVVTINADGSTQVNDGNHRVRRFQEQGYEAIPAWVNDERARAAAKKASADETPIAAKNRLMEEGIQYAAEHGPGEGLNDIARKYLEASRKAQGRDGSEPIDDISISGQARWFDEMGAGERRAKMREKMRARKTAPGGAPAQLPGHRPVEISLPSKTLDAINANNTIGENLTDDAERAAYMEALDKPEYVKRGRGSSARLRLTYAEAADFLSVVEGEAEDDLAPFGDRALDMWYRKGMEEAAKRIKAAIAKAKAEE